MPREGLNRVMRSALRTAAVVAAALALAHGGASAQGTPGGTLDRIRASKTIRIAYRADAVPFSFRNSAGQPAGFMVDLCKAVAARVGQQLSIPSINLSYVLVTAADRFDAVRQGRADLLCEPTSATLARREIVDFSTATYIDGAGLLVRGDGPRSFQGLAGQQIGVLAGTTTEEGLRNSLKAAGVTATIVPATTHADGIAMLDAGKISAYFGDRGILQFLVLQSKDPGKLALADQYFSVEPYALGLPRGDENFRLAVDRALSRIYRSGEISALFASTFGGNAAPSQILQTLYVIAAYPE